MANSSLVLSSLDFDTLKSNLKEYLKSQSTLKDYNFDGSNMSVLLDVMAYNSYLNSFYLNMVAAEMFLDSAQKYESVISHAKELNYTPRSAHAAAANVSMILETTGLSGKLTVPKETKFTGFGINGNFSFVTKEPKVFVSANNSYSIDNLQIFEGVYLQDSFVVDYDIENQRFVLSNQNIDIDTISVKVVEDDEGTITFFTRSETLFGIDSESSVYFIQACENNKYEIIFGDDLFGRRPKNNSKVIISYLVTNGSDGNGIYEIVIDDDLGTKLNANIDIVSLTLVSSSFGGANQENIESIRFAAPRYFATQQRAVSTDDYAALVLNNFGGEISDVAVFGGQEVEPKQYGRVIVSLKPVNAAIAPDYVKNKVSNYLLDYIAVPGRIVITDPDYFYCYINTTVQYDKYLTVKSTDEIKNIVLNAITNFSSTNIEKFGNDLRYSRLTTSIDDSDESITSNKTELRLIKRLAPKLNFNTSYVIETYNPIFYEVQTKNVGVPHAELYLASYDVHFEHASVISSLFSYYHPDTEKSYDYCHIADDGEGILKVYALISGNIIPLHIIGSVNYDAGTVNIDSLIATNYTNHISLYFKTVDLDLYSNKNKIILIDPPDVKINIIEIKK